MKGKLGPTGIFLRIAIPTTVYVIAAVSVMVATGSLFNIAENARPLQYVGTGLMILGFFIDVAAASTVRRAMREGRLAATGLYAVIRDPMYFAQIFLILPGFLLLFNSWLVLAGVVVAYAAYRVSIGLEHQMLENQFGEEHRQYVKKVPIRF